MARRSCGRFLNCSGFPLIDCAGKTSMGILAKEKFVYELFTSC